MIYFIKGSMRGHQRIKVDRSIYFSMKNYNFNILHFDILIFGAFGFIFSYREWEFRNPDEKGFKFIVLLSKIIVWCEFHGFSMIPNGLQQCIRCKCCIQCIQCKQTMHTLYAMYTVYVMHTMYTMYTLCTLYTVYTLYIMYTTYTIYTEISFPFPLAKSQDMSKGFTRHIILHIYIYIHRRFGKVACHPATGKYCVRGVRENLALRDGNDSWTVLSKSLYSCSCCCSYSSAFRIYICVFSCSLRFPLLLLFALPLIIFVLFVAFLCFYMFSTFILF